MAVEKRSLEQTYVHSRNVRARLFYQLHPEPKHTSILKRHRYTKTPLNTISFHQNTPCQDPSTKIVTPPCKSHRIRFYNKVSVLRIPSRYQYPESMKKNIWGTMKEISENARRNTIEFAAEGWDWRRATEDDAMYIGPNGERIHPVHVRRGRFSPKRKLADV